MNVADLELCKELFKMSGWGMTDFYYDAENELTTQEIALSMHPTKNCPAYDLGYLLRKLPRHLVIKKQTYHLLVMNGNDQDDNWIADYVTTGRLCWLHEGDKAKLTEAKTMENATAKLAIELFKQKVLKKEKTNG